MHLVYEKNATAETRSKKSFWKLAAMFVLFCILIIFLWQYNLVPFQINAEINKASALVSQKQCDQAFVLMNNIIPEHSFLDSYSRMEYVQFEQTCAGLAPQNTLAYITSGLGILGEAIKIQPLYTRYWIWSGNLTTALAGQAQNQTEKNNLIKQADYFYDKALQLAPKHQELLVSKAKVEIISGNYDNAKKYSQQCLAMNPNLGDCYWGLALSEIYEKDLNTAAGNIQLAISKGYVADSEASLDELVDAYGSIPDYKNLASVFEKLIVIRSDNAQYHFYLAVSYAKLGEYSKARDRALRALVLDPGLKQNVDTFLNSLP